MLQIFMVALIGIELVTKQPAQEFRPQFDRTNVCVCVFKTSSFYTQQGHKTLREYSGATAD